MMIAEMASYYKTCGKSLYDAMQELYERYGAYSEKTINVVMPGISGLENMRKLMESLRKEPPKEIAGEKVRRVRDYLSGKASDGEALELVGSDVLYFEMEDDTRFIIRPSGTEPKIKVYILAKGENMALANATIEKYAAAAEAIAK